jgi:hypothetical protein
MMPILERIVDMGPDDMETFTPPGIGGDVDLREAEAPDQQPSLHDRRL